MRIVLGLENPLPDFFQVDASKKITQDECGYVWNLPLSIHLGCAELYPIYLQSLLAIATVSISNWNSITLPWHFKSKKGHLIILPETNFFLPWK